MSAHTGDEAEGDREGSLYTLNEAEESEDVSLSYVSGYTDSDETLHTQAGTESVHIPEQSTPTGDDASGVAKEDVETEEQEEEEEETISESEASKEDEINEGEDQYEHEYITPIEDPYQKALKYFAKHGILELFGDITALIVLHRPENPYDMMVDEIAKHHEVEIRKGHMTPSDCPYVPPKRTSSFTMKPGRATVGSEKSGEKPTIDIKKELSSGFDLKGDESIGFGSLQDVLEIPENILVLSDDNDTAIVGHANLDKGSHLSGKDSRNLSHDSLVEQCGTDQENQSLLVNSLDNQELDGFTEREIFAKTPTVLTAESSVSSVIMTTPVEDTEYKTGYGSVSGHPADDNREPSNNEK